MDAAPEKRARVAAYVRQWCRDTARRGHLRRIQEAVEEAVRRGMSDEDIIAEATKAVRRARRRRSPV